MQTTRLMVLPEVTIQLFRVFCPICFSLYEIVMELSMRVRNISIAYSPLTECNRSILSDLQQQ